MIADTVILLEGDIHNRTKTLNKIKASLSDSYETFFFDKQHHYEYAAQIISELSCFGENRLFIIRELPYIEAPDAAQARTKVLNRFKKLFPKIPKGNVVVFNDAGILAKSFFKEVEKYGTVHNFPLRIKKSDANILVSNYFKRKGINFNNTVTALITDSLNPIGVDVNADKLRLLNKKLYNYIYGKSKIKVDDIYQICSSSREFIIWTLYNKLDNGDYCFSIKFIQDYLEKAQYFQQEVILLVANMIWRYGLLLTMKSCLQTKMPLKEISDKISNIKKLGSKGKAQQMKMSIKEKEGEPLPEYSVKMINSTIERRYGKSPLNCYTFNELLLIYYTLVKTAIKIRCGCTDAEIMIAIKIIILVIAKEIQKKNTIDGLLEHKKMLYGIWNDGKNI